MKHEHLIELYKLATEKEKYFLSEHQNRISFYVGLLSALIGATVFGIFYSNKWYHFVSLVLGPIAIIAVSYIAKRGTERLYQRFLEAITEVAKLENSLGYDKERNSSSSEKNWITTEPFVTKRHMESRSIGKSSKEWVDYHLRYKNNYHGVTKWLFNLTIVLGFILLGFIIFVTGIRYLLLLVVILYTNYT